MHLLLLFPIHLKYSKQFHKIFTPVAAAQAIEYYVSHLIPDGPPYGETRKADKDQRDGYLHNEGIPWWNRWSIRSYPAANYVKHRYSLDCSIHEIAKEKAREMHLFV